MKTETKEERLFKLMKRRWVSIAVSWEKLGYSAVSQRVSVWRKAGINIIDRPIPGTHAKEYRIP